MNLDIRMPSLTAVVIAWIAVAAPFAAQAQSAYDEQQQLIAQVQADKRTVVLKSMALDDAQVRAFTPIYDKYQAERKELMQRGVDLLNLYASNYDSMTDDAAKKIMKNWFKLQDDKVDLVKDYARQFGRVLPAAKVIRFVQIENKLDVLLQLSAVANVPLAK
jgi:hypothetical protein